jgi:hypothetical protein
VAHGSARDAGALAEAILGGRARADASGTGVVLRGRHRTLPVEVRFERPTARRGGARAWTTISLEADAAGAPIRLGSARRAPSRGEAWAAFPQPELAGRRLFGTPRALVTELASGPLGDRLAALDVASLDVGPCARRAGMSKRGVRLVARGWPLDTHSLYFALDTAAELHAQIHGAVPALAGDGAWTLGMLPEVVLHEAALRDAHDHGRFVLAALLASMFATTAASLLLGA